MAIVIAAIEGATLDETTGLEQFRHVDLGGQRGKVADRGFTLALIDWSEDVEAGRVCDMTHELEVFYGMHDGVANRMLDDTERINGALRGLHSGDLCNVSVGPWSFGAHGEFESTATAITQVTSRYQLDSGV